MYYSRIVSEIDGDFRRKSKNLPTPVYFAPSPLELGIGAGTQKTRMDATRPSKKFDGIFSRLDTMHQRDGQTDTGRQRRPRFRIALRGKNQLKPCLMLFLST